jgi:nitric oxide dioxygenase
MPLHPDQAALIQESFTHVARISDAAAEIFYGKLFALDPSVKPMFKGDMKEQGRKLMAILGVAVASARNPGALAKPLEQLAGRHVNYGVKMHHFDTVGIALLWTLEQGLGDKFTPATRDAWAALYHDIVAMMAPRFVQAAVA